MLRIASIMMIFVLSIFLTQCNDSYAKFESISIERLVCSQASSDFEELLNIAVKNGVNFQFSKSIWEVETDKINIEKLNSNIKQFIEKHKNCINEHIPALKLNTSEENPDIFFETIMNSNYFFSFQRDQPIVRFYLNNSPFDKNEISLVLKSINKKNKKSKEFILKTIQKELLLLKEKYTDLSNSIYDIINHMRSQQEVAQQMRSKNIIDDILVCGVFLIITIVLIFIIVLHLRKYVDSNLASKLVKFNKCDHYYEINNKLKRLESDINKINIKLEKKNTKLDKKNINDTIQTSISIEDSQKNTSLPQKKVHFELENYHNINNLLDEYHNCLDKGKEKLFIDKWNPICLSLENLNERRENSSIKPKFSKVSNIHEAQFWLIQEIQKDNNWILLPAKHLYKSNALTSAGGRGSDLWIKGIFDVIDGEQFRVVNYALIDKENNITKGEISLPTAKSKKTHLTANDESSNFGIGRQ